MDLGVDIRRGPKRKEEKNLNWEFFYDVCFFKPRDKRKDGYFTPKTPLNQALIVLECEWNRGNGQKDILYDFSKLLIARAELRCLVFYTTIKCEDFVSILERVKKLIAAFWRRRVFHLCYFDHFPLGGG